MYECHLHIQISKCALVERCPGVIEPLHCIGLENPEAAEKGRTSAYTGKLAYE